MTQMTTREILEDTKSVVGEEFLGRVKIGNARSREEYYVGIYEMQ